MHDHDTEATIWSYPKHYILVVSTRGSSPEVLLGKDDLKICSRFKGEQPRPKCDFSKVALQLC